MQREHKLENWPVLLMAILLVIVIVSLADFALSGHKPVQTYAMDVAGAITAVVISIVTYDEWERRRERRRYLPPEKMGVARIQEETNQLLYQYAFMLNLRFHPQSKALRSVNKAASQGHFEKPKSELRAKSAKYIAQSQKSINHNLLSLSRHALKKAEINKQTVSDANQLILQTERAIQQIDLAVATYGYSFTPEIHKWALEVRETISQALTDKIAVFNIRLAAITNNRDKPLDKQARAGFLEVVNELLAAGLKAKNIKVEQ
jgi:frataxin-like iron-binding protein CyaY